MLQVGWIWFVYFGYNALSLNLAISIQFGVRAFTTLDIEEKEERGEKNRGFEKQSPLCYGDEIPNEA